MNKNRWVRLGIIALLAVLVLLFKQPWKPRHPPVQPKQEQRDPPAPPRDNPPRQDEGFNRNEKRLIYTKHARCRMDCRHIDEEEVKEILANGRINERKSDPAARPDPKYALEGTTRDGQEVRIIFAPSARGMVVITVIDLGKDWACDCK